MARRPKGGAGPDQPVVEPGGVGIDQVEDGGQGVSQLCPVAQRSRRLLLHGRIVPQGSDTEVERLFLSEGSVSRYTTSIFAKLDLAPTDEGNRRVLAVLAYLNRSAGDG